MTLRIVVFAMLMFGSAVTPTRGQDGGGHERVLFEETFDDKELDLGETWMLEGRGRAWIENGRLTMQEDSGGVGIVLWIRPDWPADFTLSFDVGFSNNRGIGVFFFAAQGAGGHDAFDAGTHRTGDYDEYIRGDLDNYSLSLHRYFPDGRNNPGSNVRRNAGFNLLQTATPDPVLESNRQYSVEISKSGASIRVVVDGKLTHDLVDKHPEGPLGSGKIGFRLRGHPSCQMFVDNVTVGGV